MRQVLKTSCGCHIVLKNKNPETYATETIAGKQILAHRSAWIKANGPIPEGMDVLHKCDIPPCINPQHLFLGTQKDNNQDRHAKGRTVTPDHTGMKRSIETRRRISQVQIGRKLSSKHKAKISIALQGRLKGPFSEEHKQKLSESHAGVGWSAARRAAQNKRRKA